MGKNKDYNPNEGDLIQQGYDEEKLKLIRKLNKEKKIILKTKITMMRIIMKF